MAAAIQPDARFIRDVLAGGGADLKKCFQCATCSAVCVLSPEENTFPRRQMIAAQWGLKDRALGDPAIWLCHNCGECTTNCPRGARPGDVMGALRAQAVRYFAWPGFLARLASTPKALPLIFLLPVLIFAAIAWGRTPQKPYEFAQLFPIPILEPLFFALSGLVLAFFAVGLARFRRGARFAAAGPLLGDVLLQNRLGQCDPKRRTGHLLIFWGFMGLALVGTAVGVATMTGMLTTPLRLDNPLKILANISAVVALAGIVLRLGSLRGSTYFDRFFFLMLAGVLATGVLSQILRLAQLAWPMYTVYFIHLTLIFALFLYAPFSKFAHLAYRTAAMALVRKESNGR